jgi:hypothetical protein
MFTILYFFLFFPRSKPLYVSNYVFTALNNLFGALFFQQNLKPGSYFLYTLIF